MSKARDIADLNATSLADLSDNSISGEFQVGSLNVGGTEVIDSSRNLTNVGGLKTVNGTSLVGSGDISAGASTTYKAVGTYTIGMRQITGQTTYTGGVTISGSSLRHLRDGILDNSAGTTNADLINPSLSGTWRMMTGDMLNPNTTSNTRYQSSLWVRIS